MKKLCNKKVFFRRVTKNEGSGKLLSSMLLERFSRPFLIAFIFIKLKSSKKKNLGHAFLSMLIKKGGHTEIDPDTDIVKNSKKSLEYFITIPVFFRVWMFKVKRPLKIQLILQFL